jgi:DUF438 domain-containing protein
MIENLSREQLAGILETIPIEISFVNENDLVRFWNKHEMRMFKRPVAVIGKSVQNCHPKQSVDKVNKLLSDFKAGKRDSAEFWIDLKGRKIYIYDISRCAIRLAGIWAHWKPHKTSHK